MTIFDLNGTVLSNRGYTSFFSGPTSDAWLEDIRPTQDGGYIACGQYLPAAGDTGNQDMFVLKLDSAGCEYPGCQPPLGIRTPTQESVDFTTYPNPFGSSIIFNVDNELVEEIIITDIRGVDRAPCDGSKPTTKSSGKRNCMPRAFILPWHTVQGKAKH